jgi:Protein of unknown function (DUF3106)
VTGTSSFIRTKFGRAIASPLVAAALLLAVQCPAAAQAQSSRQAETLATNRTSTNPLTQPAPTAQAFSEAKPRWRDLSSVQAEILKPLEREWPSIDAERKQKWLAIAAKYPAMAPAEQARVQERMAEWAKLSPKERGLARQQFQAAKRVAPQDRPAQWEAYQALPPEQRRKLSAQAAATAPVHAGNGQRRAGAAERTDGKPVPALTKSNIVPNPAHSARPTPITSAAVQVQPGATTTSIARKASPPAHQQTGLPKIAASPGFVDKATLLPKRGPQGAAARTVAASEPARSQ